MFLGGQLRFPASTASSSSSSSVSSRCGPQTSQSASSSRSTARARAAWALEPGLVEAAFTINIDHHHDNPRSGT